MYFIVDASGTVTTVNPFGAEQLGYSVNELVGQPVLNVFYGPDRLLVQKAFAKCVEQLGKTIIWEFRKVRKDGTVIWVRETAKAVERASGPIVLIACEDITVAKRSQQELEQAFQGIQALRDEFRRIIDTIPAMIWSALPDGSVDFVNQRWVEYTGRSLEEGREEARRQGWTSSRHPDTLVHPEDAAKLEEWRASTRDRMSSTGEPYEGEFRFRRADGEYRWVMNRAVSLRDRLGKIIKWYGTSIDIEDRKRTEETVRETQAQLARESAIRATQLTKANQALRGCLDMLASVPELDDFLGQVMVAITGQLGAISCMLRVFGAEQKRPILELLFQDGRVMSPTDAGYPEIYRSLPLEELGVAFSANSATVLHLADPQSVLKPDGLRSYLLEHGVRTLLTIPLISHGQINGVLGFRFAEDRDFQAEELEIARALATQAGLAIQLTELAKTAKRSAVLEERNHLAGEIHDSLAQFFTGISMQLDVAKEVITEKDNEAFGCVERANDLARFGLAEARRSAFSLQPTIIEESGLIEALQKMVERSNIPGRLRCNFDSSGVPEERLPPSVQQDLLRIAQEAMSNAVRHAKPTVISVNLRCNPPDIVLEVIDNGSGMADSPAASREGLGFSNMRARAENIGAQLKVRTAPGRGTTIVVQVPMNF